MDELPRPDFNMPYGAHIPDDECDGCEESDECLYDHDAMWCAEERKMAAAEQLADLEAGK